MARHGVSLPGLLGWAIPVENFKIFLLGPKGGCMDSISLAGRKSVLHLSSTDKRMETAINGSKDVAKMSFMLLILQDLIDLALR